jgi:phenylacetate-coenzyme A ligase PaaK-like adenylate-forming protein
MAGFPAHSYTPLSEPERLVRELAGLAGRGAPVGAITSPSTAVRISAAAQAGGVGLERVTFILGGEPLTAARRSSIEASGARALPNYGFSEAGTVGGQCPYPIAPDEVHVAEDGFALLQHRRPLPDGEAVDALLLTTLLPASPKIMLNAEIGDYATIETRRCECVFDRFGFHRRLHTIRSFEKLTGEGVTFAGSDLDKLLEQVLPSQFGGTPADYQLVEQQDSQGLPRYELLISPEVGPLDEAAVLALFLHRLGQTRLQYRFMAEQWAQTGSLKLRRERPIPSPLGKVMPFRTLQAR